MHLRNVTLEMSLKPFHSLTPEHIESVCRRLFRQWAPLIARADQVSIMLWVADGSEVLVYRGDLDEELEWARYIGGANPRAHIANDPEGKCLHSRWYLYREDAPRVTYRDLATIVAALKRVGGEMTGKPVLVGETFDPGPEFARSPFKYEHHNEICLSGTMGRTSFVCCYTTLHADQERYAGFPDGIPEGLPFGTFLGRQSQHFLTDLGFDFLWLSNGFGFGMETWATTGAIFDGEAFHPERVAEVSAKLLDFWRLFRAECPDFPLQTRGTNLTTGIDLVSDGVPLREIYQGDFGMAPPPNSPWAALNGDFGFELVGYMSHIAEVPASEFPFRYYVHDPWWLNSPWLDRYGREPHDVYLPLSVGRVAATGQTTNPTTVNILTVDDSYGEMPEQCPLEVIPHLLAAVDEAPDAPGPLVWVYPFDEYHEWTFGAAPRLEEVFFGDWFIRAAVNQGTPLNTVVSTRSFLATDLARWRERVLVTPAPDAGTPLETALLAHVRAGGTVILYGPLGHASEALRGFLGVTLAKPLDGLLTMRVTHPLDEVATGGYCPRVEHNSLLTGGGLAEAAAEGTVPGLEVLAELESPHGNRRGAVLRRDPDWHGGALAWVRGTDSYSLSRGAHLLAMPPGDQAFPGGMILRLVLAQVGYELVAGKQQAAQRTPITTIARHAGGYFFSGYTPDTTVSLALRLPAGAPLLVGTETQLQHGRAQYHFPRAWHRECRVFVDEQEEGVVSCLIQHSGEIGVRRRLLVSGLREATLRFTPEPGTEERVQILQDPRFPFVMGNFLTPEADPDHEGCLVVRKVTGSVLISW